MSLRNNILNIISSYLVGDDVMKKSIKYNSNQIIRSTKDIYPRDEEHFIFFYNYIYFISNGIVKVYRPHKMIHHYKNNDNYYVYECFLYMSKYEDEKKILWEFNLYFYQ